MPTAVRLKKTVMKTNVNAGRGKTGGNKSEQNGGASRNAKREVSKEGRSFERKSLKEKSNVSEMPKRKLLGERGKHVVKEEAKNMRNRSKLPKKSGAWNGSKNAIGDSDSEETELPAKRPSFVKGRGTHNPERIVSKEGRYSGPKSLKDKSNILEVPKRKLLEKRGKSAVKDEAKNTRNRIKLPRKSGAWDSSNNATDDSESEETELPAKRPASLRGRGTRKDDMSKYVDSKRRFNDTRVKEKTGSSEVCNGRKKSSTRTIGKDLSVDGLSKDADGKRKTNARRVREKTGSLEVCDGRKKLSTRMIGKDLSAERGTRIGRVGLEEKSTIRKRKGNEIETLDRFSKRRATSKGTVDAKTVVVDEMPRKKKRTIRIDPYDISNKRLDDSVALKEKVVEEKPETSRNAQFRAIEPSPSIVSFVEDNLLGRRRLIDLRRAGYNIKLSAPLDNIPFSTNAERERIEENVFRNKLTFFAAAKVSSSFPPPEIPEIAFAGRSNVGKSSLLNALTRQWGVVRISDKPGLTQTINFFHLASKLCLVDLPGYGFAYAKEEVKDAWEELVKEYVSTRIGLKRVCVLIDTQWGMKPRDHELIDLMERSQTKYQIVLTKTDMVFPINVARRAMQIEENLKTSKSMVKPVMMVSSKSGAGIRSLRTVLANVVRFAK